MAQNLVEMEKRALEAQRAGQYESAIRLWREIIEIVPNWEHGYAHYYLADCYTRTGQFDEAEQAYRRAIELEPQNEMFSSGLQSFIDARRSGAI
jgi:small glutamine-rich tetratricopeptide repeat-containing protein alpha